ncbi:hypothetical protein DRO91_04730 [Candidatus Heimdallarchaeota archaeon]|nr:MAG: hypothetical protein DRP02_05485 [Candidatus Gerdarchaeota archaeon]RLI72221.1 MAG: hypothetical protein DRO91_04730 [Candidatus Heimdallarchaeota archaeon]
MASKEAKFCSYCSSVVKSDDQFCQNCGASLELDIEKAASAATIQPTSIATPYSTTATTTYQVTPTTKTDPGIMSIISFVAGVISFFMQFMVGPLGIPVSLIAIIIGFIGVFKEKRRGLAIGGIILGFVGIAIWVLLFLLVWKSIFWFT